MQTSYGRPGAIACIKGGSEAPGLSGAVSFYQHSGGVMVVADIRGLPTENETGFFAFHIHEGDNCCGQDFAGTGGHYDPSDMPHPEHSGDLPPLICCRGRAYMAVLTNRFCLRDVVGRTVVIHSGPDDFHTQPAGNSGTKIACGVIHRL